MADENGGFLGRENDVKTPSFQPRCLKFGGIIAGIGRRSGGTPISEVIKRRLVRVMS